MMFPARNEVDWDQLSLYRENECEGRRAGRDAA